MSEILFKKSTELSLFCPQINMSEESIKMEEGGDLNLDSTENLADTGAINKKIITIIKLREKK